MGQYDQVIKETQGKIIVPAMKLLPANMSAKKSEAMLLAIGLQESRLHFRKQIGGPAKGLWQFEKGGGVRGVMTHAQSAGLAKEILGIRGHAQNIDTAYNALEHDDILACVFARLLLWTDPYPLPELEQSGRSWNLYLRVWRPGKPHESTWGSFYDEACKAVA